MSVAANESGTEPEAIELPDHGDQAFGALMDALAPEPEGEGAGEEAGEAGASADTAADGGDGSGADAGGGGDDAAGQQPAADAPDAAAGADAAGDQGAADGGAEQPAPESGGGDLPEGWDFEAADLAPVIGELSTHLEEAVSQAYQATALEEVREEYTKYFEAIEQHPRLLVGRQVPAVGKEGSETLQSTADAREWQEAVKSLLVREVRDRASREMEENSEFLATVHSSIELFQNNHDLLPMTKTFDVELANRFAKMAEPYELRVEGKLQGYSIPVQPIIDMLREQLKTERAAAKPAAPATPAAPAKKAAAAADPPQAGIPSKAGNSGAKEDFSTLFGTIGLPNLQI